MAPLTTPPAQRVDIERRIVLPFTPQRKRVVPECLFQLDDGRWMLAYNDHFGGVDDESPSHIRYLLSDDDGATWSKPHMLVEQGEHQNVFGPALLRLHDGRYGLTYGAFDDWKSQHMYFCYADDPLGAWSKPVRITDRPGVHGNAGQRLLQLKSGRLIQPGGWAPSETPQRGIAHEGIVWRSDDGGATWQASDHNIKLPKRGVMEPVIVELRDGQLLMFMRNQLGVIYRTLSSDEGQTWSEPEPTQLQTPESCCFLTRIEPTGDLAVIWNHSEYDPQHVQFGLRRPLSVAISQDEGESWSQPVDLETDGAYTYAMPVAGFTDRWAMFAYYVGHGIQWSGHVEGAFARMKLKELYHAGGIEPAPAKESH